MASDSSKCSIYVLALEHGKYYVGSTNNPEYRIKQHFDGYGSEWTKIHHPRKVLKRLDNLDKSDEEKITLDFMIQYGIENVRGGSYCQIVLPDDKIKMIQQSIRGISGTCFNCGKRGHFVKDCQEKKINHQESKDEEMFMEEFFAGFISGFRDSILKQQREFCVRCGRDTHNSNDCYATTTYNGNQIPEGLTCYKCGRQGHSSPKCYARKDIWGNELSI